MRDILTNPIYIIAFLTIITLLVAAHELGHYLFARLFKMEVEEFAIGFGKQKWVWRRGVYRIKSDPKDPTVASGEHETEFTLRPFPLGGFVRVKGMTPEEDGSETKIANGFYSRSPGKRWLVLFAGPLFSVLAGYLLLIPLYAANGIHKFSEQPVLGGLSTDGAGYAAGLRAGDRILSLDGKPIKTFFEATSYIRERPGTPIAVEFERKGETKIALMTPKKDAAPTPVLDKDFMPTSESKIQGRIGASPNRELVKVGLAEAAQEALVKPIKMVEGIIGIFKNPARFKSDVGGPITILAVTKGAVDEGLFTVIELCGLLSISLGVFNLFPVPPLDGGQMVVATVEMFRRGRRLSMKLQEAMAGIGMLMMVALIVSVLWVDITRFVGGGEKRPAVQTQSQSQQDATKAPSGDSK